MYFSASYTCEFSVVEKEEGDNNSKTTVQKRGESRTHQSKIIIRSGFLFYCTYGLSGLWPLALLAGP